MAKKFNLADLVAPIVTEGEPSAPAVSIPLQQLRENPWNFYSVEYAPEELMESIKVTGLLTPLTVYKIDGLDAYRIISGHRRYKALKRLHEKSGLTEFGEALCYVVPAPSSEAMERLMVIHANSTGRKMTSAELGQQARALTEALKDLKKQGVELPDKMRTLVAEAMDVSETKLARLSAIENGLKFPGFQDAYRAGTLPEDTAYKLSRLSRDMQARAWDYACFTDQDPKRLPAKQVELFCKDAEKKQHNAERDNAILESASARAPMPSKRKEPAAPEMSDSDTEAPAEEPAAPRTKSWAGWHSTRDRADRPLEGEYIVCWKLAAGLADYCKVTQEGDYTKVQVFGFDADMSLSAFDFWTEAPDPAPEMVKYYADL